MIANPTADRAKGIENLQSKAGLIDKRFNSSSIQQASTRGLSASLSGVF
jgi:hypothetical protein